MLSRGCFSGGHNALPNGKLNQIHRVVDLKVVHDGPGALAFPAPDPDRDRALGASAAIAPQGSSANLLFAGSGYLSQEDLYRLGAFNSGVCLLLYLLIGTPWPLLVTR